MESGLYRDKYRDKYLSNRYEIVYREIAITHFLALLKIYIYIYIYITIYSYRPIGARDTA